MAEEPSHGLGGEMAYAAAYLRYYRATMLEKCRALPEPELRRPRLPSGWTPLELLAHVVHMEQRWIVWGFLGEQVATPWGDNADGQREGRWFVAAGTSLDDVAASLDGVAARTEQALADHAPEETAVLGGRFTTDPPDLRWICLHVLQEYARHAGHLDVVVELAGGPTGE